MSDDRGVLSLILLALAIGLLYVTEIRPVDVMGLCPMALDMIKLDTEQPGFETALASWQEFAREYRCQ